MIISWQCSCVLAGIRLICEWQKNSSGLSEVYFPFYSLSGLQPSFFWPKWVTFKLLQQNKENIKKRKKETFQSSLWEDFWKLPKYSSVFIPSTDFSHKDTQLRYKELSFKETGKFFWVAIYICKHFIIMELVLTFLVSQRRGFTSWPWCFSEI